MRAAEDKATGLVGKSIIITGGASGIGAAAAVRAGARGANVVVADLDEEKGQAIVAEITDDQDVERPKLFHSGGYRRLKRGCIADVEFHVWHSKSAGGFCHAILVNVGKHHLGAFRHETPSDRFADAGSRAGHQNGLVSQIAHLRPRNIIVQCRMIVRQIECASLAGRYDRNGKPMIADVEFCL
ncbi:NAD(P)-dependent dehydrogenase (short-subunit alcohol dehydrogenase family) [Croceicoccus naphthovorans]|uniref:Uncharacterized protein n=1 Tax=Croceicoccus naphthovorans TaxID=1348774 RepID=A0A0G3XHR4_9SPHN|nr:SDR family NAD(P)-dependent oxidoreductase [Croceicoccus naphthovorans]AKM10742.1 hypothetical protein AB433_13435 [Croceicoccus naphthovorans]MBB3988925.1 NAD(P)-dependent dehydrogenase (short-subunit alcohol dehydrogenase family) [Croceicoccus naphthovorans]